MLAVEHNGELRIPASRGWPTPAYLSHHDVAAARRFGYHHGISSMSWIWLGQTPTRAWSDRRAANLPIRNLLSPYKPDVFFLTYSRILARTSRGSCGAPNIRLMLLAERPEPL